MKSMGVAYAVSADKAAGVDINQVQKDYLWMSGLKMVGMALLMGVVTVLVGFFASRVGAGVGRDLSEVLQCRDGQIFNSIPDHQKYQ